MKAEIKTHDLDITVLHNNISPAEIASLVKYCTK